MPQVPFIPRLPHARDPRCPHLRTDDGCYWCCELCDVDRHVCLGCGEHLTHLGNYVDADGEVTRHECPTLVDA